MGIIDYSTQCFGKEHMAKYVVGVDNGGTVTKAGVYDVKGHELAIATRTTEMVFPAPGFTERDMHQLWRANTEAIREAIQRSGVDPSDIVGVATTGHGNGIYFIGPDGDYVENGVVSTDLRALDYVEQWKRDGTADSAYQQTLQNIWAGQTAALLAWYRDNKPEVLERTKHVLCCKDVVRYKLTGEIATEMTDLSGTNLMDVRRGEIDSTLLEKWGIGFVADKIPKPVWSTEPAGRVTEAAARETGLRAGTVVAGGLFDIVSMAIATGVTEPDQLCVIGGTWSINEFVSPVPVESHEVAMNSLYCIPGLLLINDSTPTSASNLEWFVNRLLSYGSSGAGTREDVFKLCNEAVATTGVEEATPVFLPFLFGSNMHPRASSAFVGLSGWHETRHLIRAVYEGIVFSHRTHVDRLRRNCTDEFKSVRISGGVTRSDVWVQMFSDALQLPVETTYGEELGCLGAAMTAGVAAGLYDSMEHAVHEVVKKKGRVEPQTELSEEYDRKFARYHRVIEALNGVWDG